jgi:hypothetical protein
MRRHDVGDSLPPPADFDLVGSYARRRGAKVEIVLADPKTEVSGAAVVRLARGKRTVEASGSLTDDARGRRLVVHAQRSALSDGNWSLTLIAADGAPEPLAARLLVQGMRPLVLLWGAKDKPSLQPASRTVLSTKQRTAATAGKALDRVLGVLPEHQAKKIRATARKTARKVLG